MDIDEAARQLGITPDGVRKRISRGQLQAAKKAGRWDIVLDTGQDTTGSSPGQPDSSIGQQDNSVLVSELQDRISNLQEQLRAITQALASRDNHITELVTVIRQQQAMLPPPPAPARRSWLAKLLRS